MPRPLSHTRQTTSEPGNPGAELDPRLLAIRHEPDGVLDQVLDDQRQADPVREDGG